ncbi:MAG TPA: hypothetical protein VK550_26790 [Polyangiaceae bacterium]|nr:hypothetical protein [Polyangiaceae bacterium]
MNNMKFAWRRAFVMVNAIAGIVVGGAVGGCGGGDGASPAQDRAEVSTAGQHHLVAGARSKELGIDSWRLHDDGRMEAIDMTGRVTASFVAHRNSRNAESGADASRKVIYDDKGSLVSDTLLASEREIFAELRADLVAAMKKSVAEQETRNNRQDEPLSSAAQPLGGPPAFPFHDRAPGGTWIVYECCDMANAAQVWQWWDEIGATPYCHYEFHGGFCSGFDECGSLAVRLGCLYWS